MLEVIINVPSISRSVLILGKYISSYVPVVEKWIYFTLDNLSKYGNIMLKFAGRYFYLLVTIFSKKKGYFSPKIVYSVHQGKYQHCLLS